MNNKQFVAREKVRAIGNEDAEMTGAGMNTDYDHPKGTGGAGGCPVKFRKREGTVDDKRIVTGMHIQVEPCEESPVHKGMQSNFD